MSADLSPEQVETLAEVVDRSHVAGGVVGYVQRIRDGFAGSPGHRPTITESGVYGGCSCDERPCGKDILILHIENLRRAYELKVEDLARETRRAGSATEREWALRERIEAVLDDWLTHAGPGSDAHRVFGPQVVSVPFAVETIRAALTDPTEAVAPDA